MFCCGYLDRVNAKGKQIFNGRLRVKCRNIFGETVKKRKWGGGGGESNIQIRERKDRRELKLCRRNICIGSRWFLAYPFKGENKIYNPGVKSITTTHFAEHCIFSSNLFVEKYATVREEALYCWWFWGWLAPKVPGKPKHSTKYFLYSVPFSLLSNCFWVRTFCMLFSLYVDDGWLGQIFTIRCQDTILNWVWGGFKRDFSHSKLKISHVRLNLGTQEEEVESK